MIEGSALKTTMFLQAPAKRILQCSVGWIQPSQEYWSYYSVLAIKMFPKWLSLSRGKLINFNALLYLGIEQLYILLLPTILQLNYLGLVYYIWEEALGEQVGKSKEHLSKFNVLLCWKWLPGHMPLGSGETKEIQTTDSSKFYILRNACKTLSDAFHFKINRFGNLGHQTES